MAAAMEVKHLASSCIKPETPVQLEVPLNVFDRSTADLHISALIVYDTPTASNAQIKLALAKALVHYPILAGKLSFESLSVIVDADSGVPVTETEVEGNLDDYLPLKSGPDLIPLHPYTEETNPLFLVQLNRFSCGAFILGLCTNHIIADGQAMSSFYTTWSQFVTGREVKPLPILDQSLLIPRDPPAPQFPHEEIEFSTLPKDKPTFLEGPMENVRVHYTHDFIHKLKERTGFRHSTFECLLSHLWKKVCVAWGLDGEVVSHAVVSVNGRPRLGIPPEYFGNLSLLAFPASTVKELLQEDLAYGAKLVREAVGKTGRDYFQSYIDFGALNKDKELHPSVGADGNSLAPDLEVDSWLGFQFTEIDMGGGAPYAVLPSWIPVEGIVIFMPGPPAKEKGNKAERWSNGIDVIVSLLPENAAAFLKIAHSID
ncbi:Rosmarinate synthase [Nymphaea thermarum]|nr:Rosmarinate synthase [Nymphaea thermarum]